MSPPFHAEQVGSLIRPRELLDARLAADLTSTYSQLTPEVQEATDLAIGGAVSKQIELGIRPITSGEYERDKFYSGFFETLEGMEIVKDIPLPQGYRTKFPTVKTLLSLGINTRDSAVAVNRIRHTRSAYMSEWQSLRRFVPENRWSECKLTMPPITHNHMQVCAMD